MKNLKSIIAVVMCAAIVLGVLCMIPGVGTSANAAGETTNLLADKNASFEAYSISGWTISAGVAQSKEEAYDASAWSLKINKSGATALSEKVAVTAGNYYAVSAQTLGGAGKITVRFYDASDVELTTAAVSVDAAAVAAWTETEKVFAAPADAAKAAVELSATSDVAVYFDAVSLVASSMPLVDPVLENGDFSQEWTSGTYGPGWTNTNTANAAAVTENGVLKVTKKTATGNGDKGYGYGIRSSRVDIVEGVAYNASIDIKLNTANSCQFYLYFYADETSAAISTATVSCIVAGDYSSDWTTLSVTGVAPVGATKAAIYVTDPWYNDGASYFDNATLTLSNTVRDASFEGPAKNSNASSGLSKGTAYVNTNATYVKSGEQSIYYNGTGQLSMGNVNVVPGATYKASVYTKLEDGVTGTQNVAVYLYFYDKNGTQLEGKWGQATPVTGAWTEVTKTYTAPAGATNARVMFYRTSGTGNIYFDDASLTMTEPAATTNLLTTNAGFETITFTNNTPFAQWRSGYNKAFFAPVYADAEHGYSAKINNDTTFPAAVTDTTYAQLLSSPVPVTVGATYSASAVAKGTGFYQVYVQFYADAETTTRLTDGMKAATSDDLTDGAWTAITASGAVAPAGATHVRVLLCFLDPSKGADVGKLDITVDNVALWMSAPAPTTAATTTAAPTTAAPSTAAPTTAPATTAPATTAPATTAPATTAPATTAPATTAPAGTTAAADTTAPATTPDTGDTTSVTAMFIVMILACTAMVALVFGTKKRIF